MSKILKEVLVFTSGKGGAGKTTACVNISAALAALGHKVLMIDTDIQKSCSRYFPMESVAEKGFFEFVSEAGINNTDISQYISKTNIDGLDIIIHNDPKNLQLDPWLKRSSNHLFYLDLAISKVKNNYDYILVDTVGTVSPYSAQEMAIRAATMCVVPVSGDWLSAEVFPETIGLFNDYYMPASSRGAEVAPPPVSIILWNIDNTRDNQTVAKQFIEKDSEAFVAYTEAAKFKLKVLNTIVPKRAAFNQAKGARIPVHVYEPKRPQGDAASDIILSVIHELFSTLTPFTFENPKK